ELVEGTTFLLGGWRRAQGLRVAQRRRQKVRVDADQSLESDSAHRVGDLRADIAALGDVVRVAEATHQLVPGPTDPDGSPTQFGRLVGEAVARNGRQHQVERVLSAAAVR